MMRTSSVADTVASYTAHQNSLASNMSVSNNVSYVPSQGPCTCNTAWFLVGTPPPCPVHPPAQAYICTWPPVTGVPPLTAAQIEAILNDLGMVPDPVDEMTDDEVFAELRGMIEELS